MSESTNAELDRRRRDLYAVSLALILFSLSGATVKPEASTIIGAFELKTPEVLMIGAWVLWAYFLWRYALTFRDRPFPRLFDDVRLEFHVAPAFRARAMRVKRRKHEQMQLALAEGGTSEAKAAKWTLVPGSGDSVVPLAGPYAEKMVSDCGGADRLRVVMENGITHYEPSDGAWPTIQQGTWGLRIALVKHRGPNGNPFDVSLEYHGADPSSPTGVLVWLRSSARAIVLAIVRRDAFSDQVLPLLVAALAAALGLYDLVTPPTVPPIAIDPYGPPPGP